MTNSLKLGIIQNGSETTKENMKGRINMEILKEKRRKKTEIRDKEL